MREARRRRDDLLRGLTDAEVRAGAAAPGTRERREAREDIASLRDEIARAERDVADFDERAAKDLVKRKLAEPVA